MNSRQILGNFSEKGQKTTGMDPNFGILIFSIVTYIVIQQLAFFQQRPVNWSMETYKYSKKCIVSAKVGMIQSYQSKIAGVKSQFGNTLYYFLQVPKSVSCRVRAERT
ncbi:hypothetical protein BDA99DRAFT_538770 [Phascolomyces articulosus]|uniref:Uncharacterized protein n=1 Tax=Phascolomyces articulosus TaxID=60185 RepID=A0AAD5PCE7_9FUNG|nr:hypothetical protein BDA99DRAFT_538770 [Phascolomyces articulosus]